MPDASGYRLPTKPDIEALCEQDEVLRVLVEADRLLSGPEKWLGGKESPYSLNGCFCFHGAIGVAAGLFPGALHSYENEYDDGKLSRFVDRILGRRAASWNDAPERTFEQVKELFTKAIDARVKEITHAV